MEIQQSEKDYTSYIKCGEILKSPLQSFPNSIILKCLQCTDVHLFLETFVTHVQEHFKEFLTLDESHTKVEYENLHGDEMESEGMAIDNISVKLEEVEDPLFPIKNEIIEEKNLHFKTNENASQRSDNSIKDFEEYEDEDSLDDFQPDDSETEEDFEEEEVKTKPKSKRKKNVKDETKSNDVNTDDDDVMVKDLPNKKKVKLSPIIDEFMKSKTNVLTLINYYKNQSDLWNKFSPYYRLRDKRKQLVEEITQNLNKKCSLELAWNQVAEIINYICGKHRDDFKRIQSYQTANKSGKKSNKKPGKYEKKSNKIVKRSWFFDDLDFLRSKAIIHLHKLDTNLPDLTPERIIQILEIYKGFPNLWNTHLIENICSNKRHDALAEMLNVLETKMDIKITTTILEQYLRIVHNYFSKEKRQKIESTSIEDSKKCNSSIYYEHMSFLEDHEGPFNCPECNGLYTKPLCFKVHKAQHNGSMPLICSQCKQEFKSVASYTTHAKRHLEDLQFICKECNMKFLRHSDLKIHLLTHTDARPYCCEICGASYRQSNSFRKHQRRHENRFSHTCHICFKGYYTKYRYVDHMNSHMNIRSYVCKICQKGFITSRALKTHAVTHEEARNHACNLCGKTFKLKIGVLQHMRTHGSRVESEKKMM